MSQIGALYTQNNKPRIIEVFKSSIVANMLQGGIICLALVALYFMLPYMGQPEELLPLMRPYLVIQVLSLPFITTLYCATVTGKTAIQYAESSTVFSVHVFGCSLQAVYR